MSKLSVWQRSECVINVHLLSPRPFPIARPQGTRRARRRAFISALNSSEVCPLFSLTPPQLHLKNLKTYRTNSPEQPPTHIGASSPPTVRTTPGLDAEMNPTSVGVPVTFYSVGIPGIPTGQSRTINTLCVIRQRHVKLNRIPGNSIGEPAMFSLGDFLVGFSPTLSARMGGWVCVVHFTSFSPQEGKEEWCMALRALPAHSLSDARRVNTSARACVSKVNIISFRFYLHVRSAEVSFEQMQQCNGCFQPLSKRLLNQEAGDEEANSFQVSKTNLHQL
ncbi:hypothetical protein EVAR_101160_1 [Eumeta japonica]|uniref:Uncharacterized protein n=1 Tax=Eumeta variegata TaxID=151549 RepID=A0A4C1SBR4_EUMVA|nr:hypothetical protein EVAR_101160_1 [Eumeta japonica]